MTDNSEKPIIYIGAIELDEDSDGNAVWRNPEDGAEITLSDVIELKADLETDDAVRVDREPSDNVDVARKTEIDDLDDAKIDLAEKGAEDGVAELDGDALIREGQIPSLAITDVEVFDDFDAVLEWDDARQGDVAIVKDEDDHGEAYILTSDDPGDEDNWQRLKTPRPPVDDVFGRTGSISAESGDYSYGQIDGEHGSEDHDDTVLGDGDSEGRSIYVVEEGASDPPGADDEDIIFEKED
ncbi:hypothetical protein [Natronobacterium gregoryi]|uniref:Phage tail protein n=2 Tax=Natronobacterium gregoryi TaxID=44930 RepID=L0AL98_NATGS|nr:hypothetical protein [Natronobacterium gregoryi]AFZ74571.1 hypothetical protein Natgr_3452 [Natronobacterium gregoryi SP2]ELY72360.1 putative bacteriophage tail fiber protein [Natronobacterium gregoryi SP2]PLK21688.1 phage tail protein [Natronobacterium gregoryi SP2]SFI95947.1 hypothetical protein SAMN05443661_110134 [Natronobacterium gregoryi]